MLTEVRPPAIDPSEAKPSIGRWFKRVGDPVTMGEPLVEIEVGNQTIEVNAPATGVLSQVFLKDGEFTAAHVALGVIMDFDDEAGTVR